MKEYYVNNNGWVLAMMGYSPNGRYLCVGGQDCNLCVYDVMSSSSSSMDGEEEEDDDDETVLSCYETSGDDIIVCTMDYSPNW